jgi:hypothetical protein
MEFARFAARFEVLIGRIEKRIQLGSLGTSVCIAARRRAE